jgi:DnaK suppressor protein
MPTTLNLQTIKQTLKEQRANLSAFAEKKQTSINAKDLSNPDKTDHAITSQNRNRETLLLDHVEEQLNDIDQALGRLETGTYGVCTDCGKNIQPARLDIMPTAALCIECQRIQDKKMN